jgi:DnaK suppressor protein
MTSAIKKEELVSFREVLEGLRSRLRDNYDQEFTLGLIENEQATLELVEEALERMENGTYGQCAECGEPIAKPRLQAIPYARHCIKCARKLEGGE